MADHLQARGFRCFSRPTLSGACCLKVAFPQQDIYVLCIKFRQACLTHAGSSIQLPSRARHGPTWGSGPREAGLGGEAPDCREQMRAGCRVSGLLRVMTIPFRPGIPNLGALLGQFVIKGQENPTSYPTRLHGSLSPCATAISTWYKARSAKTNGASNCRVPIFS